MIRVPLATLLLALLCAAPTSAKEGEGEKVRVNVKLKNTRIKPDGGQEQDLARFDLAGRLVNPLPDGTRLHVTLAAKGKSRDQRFSMIRLPVKKNTFSGGVQWKGQKLAALEYRLQVDLLVDKQPPAIQKWIKTEYGFPKEHRERLIDMKLMVGSDDERSAFALANLRVIIKHLDSLDGLRNEGVELCSKPAKAQPDFIKKMQGLIAKLRTWRQDLHKYQKVFVVLPGRGFFDSMITGQKAVSRALVMHARRRPGIKLLEGVKGRIATMRHEVNSRLPLQHPDDEKKN